MEFDGWKVKPGKMLFWASQPPLPGHTLSAVPDKFSMLTVWLEKKRPFKSFSPFFNRYPMDDHKKTIWVLHL